MEILEGKCSCSHRESHHAEGVYQIDTHGGPCQDLCDCKQFTWVGTFAKGEPDPTEEFTVGIEDQEGT